MFIGLEPAAILRKRCNISVHVVYLLPKMSTILQSKDFNEGLIQAGPYESLT